MKKTLIILASLTVLAACSDRQQTADTPNKDTAPYSGTGVASFTQPGWKAGDTPADKAAWEQHLKARMQYSQNDYTRTN